MSVKTIAVAVSIAAAFMLPMPARSDDAQFERCKAKLVKASEIGVLHAFDWKPPKAPYVVVGLDLHRDDHRRQGRLCRHSELLPDGAANPGSTSTSTWLHYKTGKAIGRFKNGRFSML